MKFSQIEKQDLFKAWLMLSIAFAIVMGGFSLTFQFAIQMAIAAITVGTGFLLHEMGHKFLAQQYGCVAEFRANMQMLVLAVLMSFFGFIFAAPGAVFIGGKHVGVKENGQISAMGPLMNIVLALIFLGFLFHFPDSILVYYGFLINSWLALFNMIPFAIFDGAKILKWNKIVYGSMVAVSFILLNVPPFIPK
jgi:Zn-dependent protease